MDTTVYVLLACFSFVFAASSHREKRQLADCDGAVENPCTTTLAQVFYPHPRANNRFLQCSSGGRMFVITCPAGEVYNQATTACSRPQVVTPVVTTNPCTAGNIALGYIFFAYPADQTKFIECDTQGQPQVLGCPTRLVYSQVRQSCILPGTNTGTGSTGTGSHTAVPIGTGGISNNPCQVNSISTGHNFYPHPDTTKFIQCDQAGHAYVMQCPSGLVWNQLASNCASPYQDLSSGIFTG